MALLGMRTLFTPRLLAGLGLLQQERNLPNEQGKSANASERIAAGIRSTLLSGEHRPHAPFLSHRQLCRKYRAGLNTVRQALDMLEKEGLLYRLERAGTFIHPRAVENRLPDPSDPLKCINYLHAPQPLERMRFYSEYLVGYTEALDLLDMKQRFAICGDDAKGDNAFLADQFAFSEQGCVIADAVPPHLLFWLRERDVPFVVHFYESYPADDLPPHNRVVINKVGAFFEAARHLLALGHKRVGFAGPAEGSAFEGFVSALRTSGLDPSDKGNLPLATEVPGRIELEVADFLDRPNRPTAIVACNDATALDVLAGAAKAGLSVPRDLSVVGYHDLLESAESDPPLTTMSSPKRLQGKSAVAMLLASKERGRKGYDTLVLDCNLVKRGSTAPPVCG